MIESRMLTVADKQSIFNVIDRALDTMYGIKYDRYAFKHLYEKSLDKIADPYTKLVGTEKDGVLVGVIRCSYWPLWPFWSPGSMFIDRNLTVSELKQVIQNMTCFLLDMAEADDRYDYIMVTRKSMIDPFARKEFFPEKFHNEYGLRSLGTIQPFEKPKFDGFALLLGDLVGKNSKTLDIRHAYKLPKYR